MADQIGPKTVERLAHRGLTTVFTGVAAAGDEYFGEDGIAGTGVGPRPIQAAVGIVGALAGNKTCEDAAHGVANDYTSQGARLGVRWMKEKAVRAEADKKAAAEKAAAEKDAKVRAEIEAELEKKKAAAAQPRVVQDVIPPDAKQQNGKATNGKSEHHVDPSAIPAAGNAGAASA